MPEPGMQTVVQSNCLQLLKASIRDNRDLDHYQSILDDNFLLHFVCGKKYNHEVAYKTILNYIHVRKEKFFELFQSLRPSTSTSLKTGIVHTLKQTSQGNPVFLWVFDEWDTHKYPTIEIIKKLILLLEELWNFMDADTSGIDVIIDLNNIGFNHAQAMHPLHVKKIIDILWNSFPLKYKSVHVVNGMFIFKIVFKMIGPVLPKKLRDRLHVHGNDVTSLHKHFSPEILPKSLGGALELSETFQDKEVLENILKKEDYYKNFAELLRSK